MARPDNPSICTPCEAQSLSCCPTLGDTGTATVSFSNPGENTATSVDLVRDGNACSWFGAVNNPEDNEYLSVGVRWLEEGVWSVGWDDFGFNDQYYGVNGSSELCSPNGSYEASCDDVSCIDPNDTSTLTVTINADSNSAPTITAISTQTNSYGDSVNLQVQASDPDAGQTITYSAVGLPLGAFINTSTGLISGTISPSVDANINDFYSVTVTVTDDASNPKTAATTFGWFALAS